MKGKEAEERKEEEQCERGGGRKRNGERNREEMEKRCGKEGTDRKI